MKLFLTLSTILSLSLPLTLFGNGSHGDCLIIRSRVLEIPDSSFYAEDPPRKGAYVIIKHKVLKVLKGSYGDEEIKVAHGVSSAKKLKVGSQFVLEIKPFEDLRDAAEVLREIGLEERPEDRIADFVFVRFGPTFGNWYQWPCTDPERLAFRTRDASPLSEASPARKF